MIKRSWLIYGIIAILIFISSIIAYGSEQKVYDEAGLFTEEELQRLEAKSLELWEALKLDLVIVTIEDNQGKTSRDFADDFYDYGGFGYGPEADGVLLLINMADSEAYISTTGIAIKYLTDARIEAVLDDILQHLPDGNYADGAMAFLGSVEYFVKSGIPANQYTYNEDTKTIVEEKQEAKEAIAAQRVYDKAGLMSPEERLQLEVKATQLRKALKMDFVVVTIDDNPRKSSKEYADDFYDSGGFGYGANADGALLLINKAYREIYIKTSGRVVLRSDQRDNAIGKIVGYLNADNNVEGIMTFFNEMESYERVYFPYYTLRELTKSIKVDAPDAAKNSITPKVYDEAGLFKPEELLELEARAQELREALKLDLVIVTTKDSQGKTPKEYAHDFYDNGGFGYGHDSAGALLLIDMENREVYISTTGVAYYLLNSERIEKILDKIYIYLSEENYAEAAIAFLNEVERYRNAIIINRSTNWIKDYANLFSREELQILEGYAAALRIDLDVDLYIYTIAGEPEEKISKETADSFYNTMSLGDGPTSDGGVLYFNMVDKEVYISTGGIVTEHLKGEKLEEMLEKMQGHLANEDYGQGAIDIFAWARDYFGKVRADATEDTGAKSYSTMPARNVYDYAELFFSKDLAMLPYRTLAMSRDLKMDLVIVTINDNMGKTSREYALDFYNERHQGNGLAVEGALLLINVADGEVHLLTTGKNYLYDDKMLDLLGSVARFSSTKSYELGVLMFLTEMEMNVKTALRTMPKPYTKTKLKWEGFDEGTVAAIGLVLKLILSLMAAFKVVRSLVEKTRGPEEVSQGIYLQPSSFKVFNRHDRLTNTIETYEIIEKKPPPSSGSDDSWSSSSSSSSSGRSTVHTSSSGTTHGGGGRSFSSGSSSSGSSRGGGGRKF